MLCSATNSFHGTNAAGNVTIMFLGTVTFHPLTEIVPPVLYELSVAVALRRYQRAARDLAVEHKVTLTQRKHRQG